MRRFVFWISMLAFIHVSGSAQAGDIVRFEPGTLAATKRVLTDVPVKALVVEFLDSGDTGIGKSVGYLVWREILTAISDQSGAGVILARTGDEHRLTDMLEQSYHSAAVKIAREQETSMVIWGAVSSAGDELYLSTYLSLLPEVAELQLKLRLSAEMMQSDGFEADITRTNFNFPMVEITRAKLFERRIITRKQAALRDGADASAMLIANVPEGRVFEAVDMDKGCFKVLLKDGGFGYLDNSSVDVPPPIVESEKERTRLFGTPAGESIKDVRLSGSYAVLDMRYIEGEGLWYQIETDGERGWVSAIAVRPRFSLPIVHFVAGLYRYQFNRYGDAQREFAQYVSAPNSAADNASMATAYQLMGASMLLASKTVFEVDSSVIEYFSKAVTATPYDSNAYALRALSTLAVSRDGGKAIPDLEKAMELDPMDSAAFRITDTINQQLNSPQGKLINMLKDCGDPEFKMQVEEVLDKHREPMLRPITDLNVIVP